MMRFRLRDIEWETDGASLGLPRECTVECEDEDGIAEALSDLHGWLVNDFAIDESTSLPVSPRVS